MRVLVAEDEPFIRMFIVDILTAAGFDILEAASGTEACQLVDGPNHVDLVVTDLNMPQADGIAVAKRAREHSPNVPVLFVSGRPDLLAALSAPRPYSYLTKPFSTKELATAVEGLLKPPGAGHY
jgi:CheY-like chemotaxis protein